MNVATTEWPGDPVTDVCTVVGMLPGLRSFQSSGSVAAPLPSAASPSISKTAFHEGVATGTAPGAPDLFSVAAPPVAWLGLAALVLGALVVAHVPMNNRASTSTPIIHFQKLGFL